MPPPKTKDEPKPTDWTPAEMMEVVSQLESTVNDLQRLLTTSNDQTKALVSKVGALEAEIAAVAPSIGKVPVEMFGSITAQDFYKEAVKGATMAILMNAPPASWQQAPYRLKLVNNVLDLSELMFTEACKRYGIEKK